MKTRIAAAAICAALGFATQARTAEPALPKDGWVSWEAEAVENAPAWCCWSGWDNHWSAPQTCKLDEGNSSYGSRDNAKTSAIRVYARTAGGKVDRIRVLAAECPVEAKTPIQNLENVTTDDSARWLIKLAKEQPSKGRQDVGEHAIDALAVHRGDLAFNELRTQATTDPDAGVRKKAIFWMGEVRGAPGAEVVSTAMFNDKDPDVRKHGAFAMTLTKLPRATTDIIRQGNTDKDGDVRAQAWFWLSQMGAPEAESAIGAALRKDSDDHVREQAVFALSQLPGDRSTKALAAVVEDKSLSNEQRKKALFWLGQSDKPGAQEYLEKVLLGSTR